MWFMFGFIILAFFFTAIILPWINRSRIQDLMTEISNLKKQINNPNDNIIEKKNISPFIVTKSVENIPKQTLVAEKKQNTINVNSKNERSNNFERQFGFRLPVWIGGIALVLSGFYMVKYSIEEGLLSPSVRTSLGVIFGIIMLYVANLIRDKTNIISGKRISQALSGAGIADLYICIFAATNLYGILPNFIGFIGMAIITILAVFLSLKHGMPIAILGLIGGMLTPAMVHSNNPSAAMMFIYLYFVVAGLIFIIKRKNWWIMALPTIIGAFVWVLFWLYGGSYSSLDSIWLMMFLIAIAATIVFSSREILISNKNENKTQFNFINILGYITLVSVIFLASLIASFSGFGNFEWGVFVLLALAGIVLAYFDESNYGFLPLVSMIIIVVMLTIWHTYNDINFAIVIALFALIYSLCAYLIQQRSIYPLKWSILGCSTLVIYYVVAYYKLKYALFIAVIPYFWTILALLLSILNLHFLQKARYDLAADNMHKQHIMSTYAVTIAAFLSIVFAIEIPNDFLTIAISAEIMAIAWIKTKINIKALKFVAIILYSIAVFLLIPQILIAIQLGAYSLIEIKLYFQELSLVSYPILQLGVPAFFFGVSSYLFTKEKDCNFVKYLELSSIILIALMGYYLVRELFHFDNSNLFIKASFFERGFITNIIFIFGLLCLQIGRNFYRNIISTSGVIFSLAAIFRIIYFDYINYNPLYSAQEVGHIPIFNFLLINYGLPSILSLKLKKELIYLKRFKLANYIDYFVLVNLFIFISLSLRQIFQGDNLNALHTSIAEIYSYSIIWLIYGISLLFFGTFYNNKMIRIASLIVIIITIGKVFLYDAAALEGLYRVFSFLGLGLCLLALSWFYSKFIFRI